VASSSLPVGLEAAQACLDAGGTAIDAALAGYFAVAGAISWALLAPVTIAMAGSGTGTRFVDGRCRQPGKGIDKPVRFADDSKVPPAVRAAVPGSVSAITIGAVPFARETTVALASYGVQVALKQGANRRAELLERVGQAKAWALLDRGFLAEMNERVPRFEGALLGELDLEEIPAEVVAGRPAPEGPFSMAKPHWADDPAMAGVEEGQRLFVLAADNWGGLAGVVIEGARHSVSLFGGEVDIPGLAVPLLKGVPRPVPGTILPMSVPLGILFDGELPVSIAASSRRRLDLEHLDEALHTWGTSQVSRAHDIVVVQAPPRPELEPTQAIKLG
jgi:gamma-glutamyltranspeptidase/glutathione hydrolase